MRGKIIYHSMPEQIEAKLRNDILTGRLKPGDPLREKEISQSFGVSRGPVREVFRQLTQQGLLTAIPNKGVRVSTRPSLELRPLVAELRLKIELFVLNDIFHKITEDDLALWEEILEDIRIACEANDAAALVGHDLAFHQAIIQSHDDQDVFALWQPIVLRMLMHYSRLGDLMESYLEHKRILDAIRNGDKEGALAALAKNIQ